MPPSEFERKLENLARVAVEVGANVQPGQRMMVLAWNMEAEFSRRVARIAYQRGARLVDVVYLDEHLDLLRMQHAPPDSMGEFPIWKSDLLTAGAQAGDAVVMLINRMPGIFDGQDAEWVAARTDALGHHLAEFWALRARSAFNNGLVPIPSPGWADLVYPDLPPEQRESQLWEAFFSMCRATEDDPVAAWQAHIAQLEARSAALNDRNYRSLRLTGPGTDLTIGLAHNHIWASAHNTSQSGIPYLVNTPTEEVYTLPQRGEAEGVVTATRPLNSLGTIIDGLRLTFAGGRVAEMSATQGQDHMQTLLDRDANTRFLGEVALVPHSSPISQLDRTFYTVVIDENAASHMALGRGYRASLPDGLAMSDEEFVAAGGNLSNLHLDFMFGSGEVDVDGITSDGEAQPLMRAGEWAFDL